jgi:hypothetical protein
MRTFAAEASAKKFRSGLSATRGSRTEIDATVVAADRQVPAFRNRLREQSLAYALEPPVYRAQERHQTAARRHLLHHG